MPFHQKIYVSCIAGVNHSTSPLQSDLLSLRYKVALSRFTHSESLRLVYVLKEETIILWASGVIRIVCSWAAASLAVLNGAGGVRLPWWLSQSNLHRSQTILWQPPCVRATKQAASCRTGARWERWDPFEITPRHSLNWRTRSKQKHKQCGRQQCANESHAAAITSTSADGRLLYVYLHLFWFSALKCHNTFILIGLQDFTTVLTLGNR